MLNSLSESLGVHLIVNFKHKEVLENYLKVCLQLFNSFHNKIYYFEILIEF